MSKFIFFTLLLCACSGGTEVSVTDVLSIVSSLPLSAYWKEIAVAALTLLVVCRWLAELLFILSRVLHNDEMGFVAFGLYKSIRAVAQVLGYVGMGIPKELLSERIEAAMKTK